MAPVKIFRPYRDVRFSADKSPYRTEIGASLGSAYVRLSAAGLAAGSGMFHLAADQLTRYREAVADDLSGGELGRIVAGITAQDITIIGHDQLKSAPRGYPADHPRIDLLRYKGLAAYQEWPVEPWLARQPPQTGSRSSCRRRGRSPAGSTTHVGPSELPENRRR